MKISHFLFMVTAMLSSQAFAAQDNCEAQAVNIATSLYRANQSTFKSVKADLVSELPSESGVVLTWDIHFKDANGNESSVPYRLQFIQEKCFVFAFSLPNAD